MMILHKLSEKVAAGLVIKNVITPDQAEAYVYGAEITLATVLNGFLVLAASIAMGVVGQGILLLIPFVLIRSNAGGFHAKTHVGCALGFLAAFISAVQIISRIPRQCICFVSLVMLLVSTVLILAIGVMKHENRPVTSEEIVRFERRTRVITVVLMLTGLFGVITLPAWFIYYIMGLFIAACSLLAAWINTKGRSVEDDSTEETR